MSLVDRDTVLTQVIRNLKSGCRMAVVTDLPPELSKRRGELLKQRSSMPEDQKKKTRLIYSKVAPFLKLVTRY